MARKPKDVTVLHGHRVITGSELRATFVEQDDTGDDPSGSAGASCTASSW